jgi:hypothetical protein
MINIENCLNYYFEGRWIKYLIAFLVGLYLGCHYGY